MSAELLFQAIHRGDAEAVGTLLDEDPTLHHARSPSGLSPILFATYYGRREAVRVLLERDTPLNAFEAAATGQGQRLGSMLSERPELLAEFSPDGFQLLGLAAFFGHENVARDLLARGAPVDEPSRNPMGVRPLHSAAAGNHDGIVRALLDAGADVDATQHGGFTALMSAAQNGNAALVGELLARGANRDARTDDGQTAADLASESGHAEVVALLTV